MPKRLVRRQFVLYDIQPRLAATEIYQVSVGDIPELPFRSDLLLDVQIDSVTAEELDLDFENSLFEVSLILVGDSAI